MAQRSEKIRTLADVIFGGSTLGFHFDAIYVVGLTAQFFADAINWCFASLQLQNSWAWPDAKAVTHIEPYQACRAHSSQNLTRNQSRDDLGVDFLTLTTDPMSMAYLMCPLLSLLHNHQKVAESKQVLFWARLAMIGE